MTIAQTRILDLLDDCTKLIDLLTTAQTEAQDLFSATGDFSYKNLALLLTVPRIASYDTERAHFRAVAKQNHKNMLYKRAKRASVDNDLASQGLREHGETYRTDKIVSQPNDRPSLKPHTMPFSTSAKLEYDQRIAQAIARIEPTLQVMTFAERDKLIDENLIIIKNAHPTMASDDAMALAIDTAYERRHYTPPVAENSIFADDGSIFGNCARRPSTPETGGKNTP